MMEVSLLNLRITFQKNTVETDAIGNHKNLWKDHYSCYATVNSESGSETEVAGQTAPQARCAFTVRYCSETAVITTDSFRILWNEDIYNITHIDHQNNKRKSLKFWAEKARR
jgi:SPP1 family predicted phage head-tail adaptor